MNTRLLYSLICLFLSVSCSAQEKPRVFVFTDINIDAGDPDDRQSLIHLLWYADELQIEGIVPDRWNAQGLEACYYAVEAYSKDYRKYKFKRKGFPKHKRIVERIALNADDATQLFISAAADTSSPLYVLVWGNMKLLKTILLEHPESADNIRLITIGTGLMLEKDIEYMPPTWEKSKPCEQLNWNGFGRNEIYHNPQFDQTWWIEMNWTYAGMFTGEAPKEMFRKLSVYGEMGVHMLTVVKNEPWAQYFRVGDTPSVLYLLDKNHNLDNPAKSSWAGRFVKPFPQSKPNYYTDFTGTIEWDYTNPCQTWENHLEVQKIATATLAQRREEMYEALIKKLEHLYGR